MQIHLIINRDFSNLNLESNIREKLFQRIWNIQILSEKGFSFFEFNFDLSIKNSKNLLFEFVLYVVKLPISLLSKHSLILV